MVVSIEACRISSRCIAIGAPVESNQVRYVWRRNVCPADVCSDTGFHRSRFDVVCADAFLPIRFEGGWVREHPSIRGYRTLLLPVLQDRVEIDIEWKIVV